MVVLPLSLLLFTSCKEVAGAELRITSASDFNTFLNNVNSGTTYSGTTVLLDSDISLSGYATNPAGYSSNQFRGVFDGQGYIIKNIKLTSSSYYTGLFGYSTGLTVRNVILDSSCSVINSFSVSSNRYVGGIIGYCYSSSSQCSIENCVNMGSVTFSGSTNGYTLHLGGIAGELYSYGNNITVKNCANYGAVTKSGTSGSSRIGGIAGYLHGYSSSNYTYLYNCLNYGTITHNGTTSSNLYLGGIAGYSCYTYLYNCLSAGKFTMTAAASTCYIGSIIGQVSSNISFYYCYYTDELSSYSTYGYGTPSTSSNVLKYSSSTFKLNQTVSIGTYIGDSLIETLNAYTDYYTLDDYSHWLLNKDSNTMPFKISSRSNPITMDYQILLLPSLASEGNLTFNGWYTDSGLTSLFTSTEASSGITLYGEFGEDINYTLTFDTRGGTTLQSQTYKSGDTVTLPSSLIKDSCAIAFWETDKGYNAGFSFTMPTHSITLYAVWKCTNIKTSNDFIDFTKVVNSGILNYSGTTVFLDSDISLSGYTNPIGYSNQFLGTFDGQGYIISNLKVTSSLSYPEYIGLFGYSAGMTVRNVILDSSCSVTNSYSGSSNIYVGGIIGYCESRDSLCNIENCVNMGSVVFSGNISRNTLHLGGIAGKLRSYSNTITVKNCANYGIVTQSGTSGSSRIGGIAGEIYGSSYKYLYNCLNYGTITHDGTTSNLYLGGIAGYSYYTYFYNCLSIGNFTMATTAASTSNIGSIIGQVSSHTYLNYCYFTDNVEVSDLTGYGTPNISNTPNSSTPVGSGLIFNLNDQAAVNNWNGWLLNSDRVPVVFRVNNRTGFSISAQVILLPNLAETGNNVFRGWFADSTYSYFTPQSVSSPATFYGLYGVVVAVSFNGTGGIPSQGVKYILHGNNYGTLATATRAGYTFTGWFTENKERITEGTTMSTQSSHTLYAHWTANNYTVIFDKNGGDSIDMDNKNVTYDEEYGDLATVTRTGYTFDGWFTDKENDNQITNDVNVSIADDHVLYAHWTANNYTVIFDKNGGETIDTGNMNVTYDGEYGTLATATRTGYTFIGWFTEMNGGTQIIDTTKVNITDTQALYAHWNINNYTVTFNFNNGTENEVRTFDYNHMITYPDDPVKEGYMFDGWDKSDIKSMPAENLVITAQWRASNYTVTFNANGGSVDVESKNVTYRSTYGELPTPTREGYTFTGWSTDKNETVTKKTLVNATGSHILYAQWSKITTQVEIVFETKDMSEKEVRKIIEQYTKADFTVTMIEDDESGETKVIIKFEDAEKAEEFVRNVSTSSKGTENRIKRVGFTSDVFGSLSAKNYPVLFLCILMLVIVL